MKNEIKNIQVLGSGCPTCKQLFEKAKKAAKSLNLSVPVEYSDDISKLIEMGLMSSPVLTVNDLPVLVGGGYSEADIKSALEIFTEERSCSGACHNCSHC
ncbi:MAG: thioredoxin family protein [Patescibacteria group bacterium]|nr:thioredoxin family protein [Patescibacteria group bacterium]